jgi:hypothetical protein
MLPKIRLHARVCFRHLDPEARQEAIQDVVCNAWKAFVALVKRGKADVAYATPLARYGIMQHRDHRRVGNRLNIRDVLSSYCQAKKHVTVERLDRFDRFDGKEGQWLEILLEDKHAGPFDIVRTKLDFAGWLRSLPLRLRRIAKFLANGATTTDAAEKFGVSLGRISQIRKELKAAWHAFVGDDPEVAVA